MNYKNMVMDIIENHVNGRVNESYEKIDCLGKGSSRIAFTHSDYPGVVCKIPIVHCKKFVSSWQKHNKFEDEIAYAITQMYFEISTWLDFKDNDLAKFLNPILEWGYCEEIIYTIAPKIVEIAYDNSEIASYLWDSEEYEAFEDIMEERYALSRGDLIENEQNYGINTQDEVVFVDYGFPKGLRGDFSGFAQRNSLLAEETFIKTVNERSAA